MTAQQMRAARLHQMGGRFQIDELPVPSVRPTDVLVKVAAAGIVGNLRNVISTYAATKPFLPLPKLPAVFGLDSTGVVAALGEGIRTGLTVGERVYVNPGLSCGACLSCRRDDPTTCQSYTFMGYFGFGKLSQNQFDAYPLGGFAEYLIAPAANLVKLPDSVSFEQACRFGYLGTAYSALRKLEFRAGQTLLLNGATGTLGVGTVLLALAIGASLIFATGRDRARLDRLKSLAPDRIEIIAADAGSTTSQIMKLTGGVGADAMVEALAFDAPAAKVVDAFNALRRGGKAVNIGGVTEVVGLDIARLMVQQKSLIGSLWFSTAEAEEMASMVRAGTLRLDVFEHEVFPLDQVNEALAAIDGRSGGFTNIVIKHDHSARS